jgi:CRP-like cAMP-binding protein
MSKHFSCPYGQNNLLATMAAADFSLLDPHLETVRLTKTHKLQEPNVPISQVYFLTSGIGSTVALTKSGRAVEIGLFGCDGLSGTPVIMHSGTSSHETFMQVEGSARVIDADRLREFMEQSPSLQHHLLRYVQSLMTQMSVTALANAHSRLATRLARWLLMCHDRVHGDGLNITHDFLAVMLGVRRAGVTEGTHILEGKGLIRANRGQIIIVDRERLESEADEIHGIAEAEYQRLIGFGEAARGS